MDEIAKAYGMIENVDANFGRLMQSLDDATLTGNTLVIFLTDNGPGGVRLERGTAHVGRGRSTAASACRVTCGSRTRSSAPEAGRWRYRSLTSTSPPRC